MNTPIWWSKGRYWVLLLLIVLITLSSHPTIVDMSRAAGVEKGTILSRYIILMFGGLFLMCLNVKSMLKPKMVRVCWVIFVFLVVFYVMSLAFFGVKKMMQDIRSIAICLVAIMIGWQMNLGKKAFHGMLLVFAGMTLFVGLMQVFTNIGGFVILDQYFTDNKNALGMMLATAGVIFFVMGLNRQQKGLVKILYFGLALIALVVMLTVRARAATLTLGLMLLYILYERFKGKNFFAYLIVGLFLAMVAYVFIPNSVKEYVYNSFTQNYEEKDITAGRAGRNAAALDFLSEHIFFGNLNEHTEVGQIHNYPLNRTFEFGIVFVLPILLIYLYLLFKAIIKTIRTNSKNNYNLGYYLLLIPFIVSMAEPTFPFGPGTATVFNFLAFGASLRNSDNELMEISNETVAIDE